MTVYRIYLAENSITHRRYVGRTLQLFRPESYATIPSAKAIPALKNDLEKYGSESFSFRLLGVAYHPFEARDLKARFVRMFRTNEAEFGYNHPKLLHRKERKN